jgi:hypothetical protein
MAEPKHEIDVNVGELVEICIDGGTTCYQGFFAGETSNFYILDIVAPDLTIKTYIRKDHVVVLKRKLKIQLA